MTEQLPDAVRRPRSDGSAVFDAILAPAGYFALPIAHERGLFRLLEGKRLTAAEICEALGLKPRPANALLAAVTSLGLLELSDDRYALTPLAEDYLLDSSPTYMGFFLDLNLAGEVSLSAFAQAVASDSPQRPDMDFESFEEQAEQARAFTRGMHSVSVAPGLAWPELIDLSGSRLLLDVAGGSGAPRLAPACTGRTCTRSSSTCRRSATSPRSSSPATASKAGSPPSAPTCGSTRFRPRTFTSTRTSSTTGRPRRGGSWSRRASRRSSRAAGSSFTRRSSTTTRPAVQDRLAFSMGMLLVTGGQQYSARDLSTMLADAGFHHVQVIPTSGYYSIVAGRKP